MTIARQYIIHAKEGHEDDLRNALPALAELVRPTPGCHGVELLHDLDDPRRFIFTEKWESREAHETAKNLEAHAYLMQIMPWYDGRPAASYCACLKTF